MDVSLSVVIPTFNEEASLRSCVDTVVNFLKKQSEWDWEIIIVNDGSSDRTGDIAKQLVKRISRLKIVTNHPNRGYGGSLKAGFAVASKDLICFIPADNQFEFSEIKKLLAKMVETNADIVSGIRVGGGEDNLYRLALRWVWNKLVYGLFGHLATDIDCGFKLFKRRILESINLPSNGAMMDTQLFAGARIKNFKIAEVEVTHLSRKSGVSTGGKPSVAIKAFKELFLYWWQLRQEIWVEQGRPVLRWEVMLLGLILVIAAGLRLYHIDGYMSYLGDEGRDAIVMRDIVTLKHLPLIGPGTSIGNMYLGPWYYYIVAPSLLLANFSPVGPAIEVALFGVLTIALLWWVGRQWFGRVPALLITGLYAISPTVIQYSQSSWNPNIMPFFALLTIYAIWKVWKLGYWQWVMVVGVGFALILNLHYLGLLLAPTLGLFWLLAKKRNNWQKYSLVGIVLFLAIMSPLVFFDMRHGWNNFSAVAKFFTDRQTTVNLKVYKSIPNLWPIWQAIVSSLIVAKQPMWANPAAIGLLILGAFAALKTRSKDLVLVVVWLGVAVVGFGLYKQHIYDHYYGFIFPAPFLLLGFGLDALWKNKITKILSVVIALGLVVLGGMNTHLRYPPNNQLDRTNQIAKFINNQSEGQPFNLALLTKQNYDRSYVYFLQQEKAAYFTIHEQLAQQLFVICEQPDCQPISNPLWEIAAFGWAKVDRQWEFPWGVKLYKLVRNPEGQPQ